jgi:hypothetical protein
MGAADFFANAHHAVAVFIESALVAPAAGGRFYASLNDFLPERQDKV